MRGTKNTKNSLKSGDNKFKQKVLLPTLKEKQRYMVYKLMPPNMSKDSREFGNDFGIFHNDILLQCNNMLGIFDGGKAGLMSVKYDAESMTGIIRVNNKYVDKLKVCLGLIRETNGRPATVDCIYVSGMLNKAVDMMKV
jgi:RNase P/RNase MRP subunit POP5